MKRIYRATTAPSEGGVGYLEDKLREVSADGGRVVSVNWIPKQQFGASSIAAHYVIVSEKEDPYA